MDKKSFSERDICTKFITPALEQANWDIHRQIREEFTLTDGRIIVRGKLHTRGKKKRADNENRQIILSYILKSTQSHQGVTTGNSS